jgi:hypothetical protein
MDTLSLFLEAAWKVFVASMLLGAGLIAVFAIGVRALAPASVRSDAVAPNDPRPASSTAPQHTALAVTAAVVCFVLVAIGVGLGLTYIVASGQGKVLSFDHGYPTLVPKP